MAILSTIKDFMLYLKESTGYVLYRLSAKCVAMDNGNDLQTEINTINNNLTYVISSKESKTHDTFFGKPVYTKTFRFTTSLSAGTALNIAHNIKNINNIWVDLSNSFVRASSVNNYTIPIVTSMYYNSAGSGNNLTVAVDANNINLYADGGWNTAWEKVVTVRYTKTTD